MADRVEWNHEALEAAEDEFADEAMQMAERAAAMANAMRSRASIAPYNASERRGRKGGRRYAVVSADAPSTVADEARTNALQKAAGSC